MDRFYMLSQDIFSQSLKVTQCALVLDLVMYMCYMFFKVTCSFELFMTTIALILATTVLIFYMR